jgi:multidrug efflux pump
VSPSRPFILRPVATALIMAAILLVGLVGYFHLPVSALPEVDYPTIQVLTFYPGASPTVMATTVTAPLERQFGELQGLSQMTSTSAAGVSVIVLQFNLTLAIDIAEEEVQSAINASQSFLPSILPAPPIYSKTNPADAPVLTFGITSSSIPLSQVEDLVDTRLAPKISQLDGVGLVTISGGQKPAVRIQANPTALSSYGINLEDLRTALTQSSVNAAKGNFDGPRQDYQIDANDQLVTSNDYRNVVVAYRNGAPVMLTDVAHIVNGVENKYQAAWMNQTPAVILNVQRQPGANTISVVNSIKALMPQLQANLPTGIQITTLTDLTTAIKASVADVEFELMLTVGLVVLVIFLFLRSLYATIIPSVAVPLSLVGTFAAMYALGYSLDNLSLMALTISTGFVVDDAIVMIENISRYIEAGDPPMEAALKGAEQIGFTILSLTVSLIAVLIPLLFMGDVVGRLFREFAVTLAVTIIVSAAVSLTLTPMMSARILRHTPKDQQGRFYKASERVFERMIAFYGRTLKFVLGYQTITLLVAVATLLLTVFLYIIIPKGFFPVQDTGVIQGISQASQTVGADEMAKEQQELAKVVLQDPAVESLSSFIGADGTNTTTNSGRMSINLKPLNQRSITASNVIRRLQPKLNQVQGIQLFMQPVQNITVDDRVSRTQYQYTLEDPDANELNDWTNRFVARLKQLPGLEDVATDQQTGGLAVSLVIDRITASRLGIAPTTIDNTLYDAFGQRQISTMYTQVNQYHVVLESEPQFQLDPNKLNHLYIQANASASATGAGASSSFASSGSSSAGSNSLTSSALYTPVGKYTLAPPANALSASAVTSTSSKGATSAGATTSTMSNAVPLSAFSHFETTTEPLSITHQGQFPAVTVSFNLAENAALGNAITDVDKVQKDMHMPPSLQADFQGTAASFRNSLSNEPILILAALVTVYIVLGVLYESFIHPITILSTLPSAGVGAFLALLLFRQDLSVVAIIGIVLLIGIVKKNGIMMVDFALEAERKHGKNSTDAIYEACLLRFRPIMMTTMAALLGGLPLALGSGFGSELRRPLGIAMVGGLLVSQALTLYTTPVIYIFFDNLAQRIARRSKAKSPELGTGNWQTRHEHLRTLHPPARSHHAPHGGGCPRRRDCI